jgi:hypothetical protein
MRILGIAVFTLLAVSVLPAVGQEKNTDNNTSEVAPVVMSAGTVPATAEMWFYEQHLREYLNPKLAVRRKAEFKAKQRRQRLAAMRWFGFSNQRPAVSPDPFNGDYSSSWTGADVLHPYRWGGCGYAGGVSYR